jgi:hypothetical protein
MTRPFIRLGAVFGLMALAGCSGGGSSPTSPGPGGGGNHSPTLNVSSDSSRMQRGNQTTVRAVASDLDGDQLTFSYVGHGGDVLASGPTATNSSFTPTRLGNDSVRVQVSDGKGGSTAATALIYAVSQYLPIFTGTKYTCSWSGTVAESLIVVSGEAAGSDGYHEMDVDGFPAPHLITPGNTHVFHSVDPCNFTLTYYHVIVQRPAPDGRQYDIVLP